MTKNKLKHKSDKIFFFTTLITPVIVALLLLLIIPFISGFALSFRQQSVSDMSGKFIGFANYVDILSEKRFWRVFATTASYTLLSVILCTFIGFVAALCLHTQTPFKGIFRAINVIPWAAPPAVISIIWTQIYSKAYSPLNDILLRFGIVRNQIDWLGYIGRGYTPFNLPLLCLVVVYGWICYPFVMLMILSGLQSIPDELYEAATVDGARDIQKLVYITLPSLKPFLVVVVTLLFIWTFQYFNLNYMLTHGGPRGYTEIFSIFIYDTAFEKFNFGKASALGILMSVSLFIPSYYYIRLALRQAREKRLK